ncbi:hypothetical protein MalM25_34810 [Planctomycetes bacterium MalM25]|nr:hypothetical protein MalM25_34810 [Planctomycetes bacterium MalM25]
MTNLTRYAGGLALLAFGLSATPPAYGDEKSDPEGEAGPPPIKTVSLGRFFVRDLRATEDAKVRLSFTLHAKIDPEHTRVAMKYVESHKHRLSNEVLTAIRTCEQNEFQEPGLKRFRRRIHARLRRAMPELPIEHLLVGEYEYLFE